MVEFHIQRRSFLDVVHNGTSHSGGVSIHFQLVAHPDFGGMSCSFTGLVIWTQLAFKPWPKCAAITCHVSGLKLIATENQFLILILAKAY